MTKECVLANAKVILRDEVFGGAIVSRHGDITAINQGIRMPNGAVDCEGATLCPALIELQNDNLERHMWPRPRVNWPKAPAIVAHVHKIGGNGTNHCP